jgi:DNA-binding GntR family transcriptional regulator
MTIAAPSTTAQHALEGLRRAIVAGELRPGQRIGQEELAERLGVSIAPVREALAALEQEGQLTYLPRRGYFVAELRLADLEEIYGLRRLLEAEAARAALPLLGAEELARVERAAGDCAAAVRSGDVAAELEANRRFHFGLLEPAGLPHTLRLVRALWDSTESYRALYYNSAGSRQASLRAHERILAATRAGDAAALVAELDAHRAEALVLLGEILAPVAEAEPAPARAAAAPR